MSVSIKDRHNRRQFDNSTLPRFYESTLSIIDHRSKQKRRYNFNSCFWLDKSNRQQANFEALSNERFNFLKNFY